MVTYDSESLNTVGRYGSFDCTYMYKLAYIKLNPYIVPCITSRKH